MAKKQTASPTFFVRFVGKGLSPATVPLRAVNDALSAVQDLASGRDPFETAQVPPEKLVGLVDVKAGSASYACAARAPGDAIHNLSEIGTMLTSLEADGGTIDEERLVAAIRPIRALSQIAKRNDCRVEVALAGQQRHPLFVVGKGDFRRIAGRVFMKGEATITGEIERAGGATDMRCLMRIPNRRKLLYCDIKANSVAEKKELVRKLGQHLYEQVSAVGTVIWIHRTWYVYRFTIHNFLQPRLGNPLKAIEFLRKSGLNAWDAVANPESLIRELRK